MTPMAPGVSRIPHLSAYAAHCISEAGQAEAAAHRAERARQRDVHERRHVSKQINKCEFCVRRAKAAKLLDFDQEVGLYFLSV